MDYKELEERLNFITHYIGTGMAIAGCVDYLWYNLSRREI